MPSCAEQVNSRNYCDDSGLYREAFRKKVFRLICLGHELLVEKDYADSDEPVITGRLVEAINNVSGDWTRPVWVSHFTAHEDPPVNVPERVGKHRKKLDIEIELTRRGPNRHYYFEAKRLSKGKSTIGDYLGDAGVGEFIAGNYALDEDEAGMLGYVQSDGPDEWAKKLANGIAKAKGKLHLFAGGWTNADSACGRRDCYRTKHRRPTLGRPITLYHLLLRFCR